MDPITGAIIGGSSLLGGLFGSSSAKKAARAQEQLQREALAEQRRQFDLTRADQAPWMQAGQNALSRLENPGANFTAAPGYDWRRSEGERGLGSSFAARGGATSGNALKALSEFNQNMASNEYGNWWNQQAGLAGVGQSATNAVGAMGQNSVNNISNILGGIGDARASGYLSQGASLNSALNNGLNAYMLYRGGYFGAPGGGGGGGMAAPSGYSMMRPGRVGGGYA
jgi:hypothetical protein